MWPRLSRRRTARRVMALRSRSSKLVVAQVCKGLPFFDDVMDDYDDTVGHRHGLHGWPLYAGKPPVLSPQVGFGPSADLAASSKGGASQPFPLRTRTSMALLSALFVTGTHPGPRRQMAWGGKLGHAGAHLSRK